MQHNPSLQSQKSLSTYQNLMLNTTMIGQTSTPSLVSNSLRVQKKASVLNPDQVQTKIVSAGFQKLQDLDGIFIKQKLDILEVATDCETENKYDVYALDKDNKKKGPRLFRCKEKSSWWARQCLSGECRPFHMDISYTNKGENVPFLCLERPWKCSFMCLGRPETLVDLVEDGKNEFLGKVADPWDCCEFDCVEVDLEVYDKEKKKYNIEGSSCQLGIWCDWPCKECQTIDFDVKDSEGKAASSVQKRSQGCWQEMVSDANNFVLQFPENAMVVDKVLLMSAVLFLDFRNFEQKKKDQE